MVKTALLAAAAALVLAGPVVARADDDDRDRDRWRGRAYPRGQHGYDEAYGIGLDKGYGEGLKHGRKDGDGRRNFNFSHDGKYRKGDWGYKSRYGSRRDYVLGFRRGYQDGYREGYRANFNGRGHRDRYGYDDRYGRDDRFGRDGRFDDYRPYGTYDWQRDGRHRHRGHSGWCTTRHRR